MRLRAAGTSRGHSSVLYLLAERIVIIDVIGSVVMFGRRTMHTAPEEKLSISRQIIVGMYRPW